MIVKTKDFYRPLNIIDKCECFWKSEHYTHLNKGTEAAVFTLLIGVDIPEHLGEEEVGSRATWVKGHGCLEAGDGRSSEQL